MLLCFHIDIRDIGGLSVLPSSHHKRNPQLQRSFPPAPRPLTAQCLRHFEIPRRCQGDARKMRILGNSIDHFVPHQGLGWQRWHVRIPVTQHLIYRVNCRKSGGKSPFLPSAVHDYTVVNMLVRPENRT
eukprot:GEMP01110631.1.p1 GENE.GEMP01110631.1~~GEMP01110631.1.p1  ORF type:complete len:129 (-),score=5.02 GEMP01110631.1:140-526(-)